MKIVKKVKMVEEKILLVLAPRAAHPPQKRDPPLMRGGRVQLPHSNKLTSPLAHMFIAVVTAMQHPKWTLHVAPHTGKIRSAEIKSSFSLKI